MKEKICKLIINQDNDLYSGREANKGRPSVQGGHTYVIRKEIRRLWADLRLCGVS